MPGMSNAKLVCSQVRTANAMATSTPIATRCFTEHFAHGEFYDAFDWTTRWVMPIGMACGFFRKPGIFLVKQKSDRKRKTLPGTTACKNERNQSDSIFPGVVTPALICPVSTPT